MRPIFHAIAFLLLLFFPHSTQAHNGAVALDVSDADVVIDTSAAPDWMSEDGCEVYIDFSHGDGSIAAQFAARGEGAEQPDWQISDAANRAAWYHGDGRHTYEWRFDLGDLDLSMPAGGRSLSFDIVASDRDDDGSFSWVAWGAYTGKAGDAERRGDVILVAEAESLATVHGRGAWVDGPALPGTMLNIHSSTDSSLHVRPQTDAQGNYSLRLPAGSYVVMPDAGRSTQPLSVQLSAGEDARDRSVLHSRGADSARRG